MADARQLLAAYQTYAGTSPSATVRYPLLPLNGFSEAGINAEGEIGIDPEQGRATGRVRGIPSGERWVAWAIVNSNSSAWGTLPDSSDRITRLGVFAGTGAVHTFDESVPSLRGQRIDRVAVTRTERTPDLGFVLTGSPALLDRLPRGGSGFSQSDAEQTVARGRALFRSETFGGNGRTCDSCHGETSNFTIAPGDLAGLFF
ncbi:MAG TPA: hypothetical protein DEH78_13115, partial [Solibacterales bacterium]|nr:hypothetical protein [Bryobacterales bacterium]